MHDDDDDEWGSTERNVVCACTEGTGLNLASQRYVTKRGATTLPQKFILASGVCFELKVSI